MTPRNARQSSQRLSHHSSPQSLAQARSSIFTAHQVKAAKAKGIASRSEALGVAIKACKASIFLSFKVLAPQPFINLGMSLFRLFAPCLLEWLGLLALGAVKTPMEMGLSRILLSFFFLLLIVLQCLHTKHSIFG